jgi:hypothetical protein
MRRVVLVRRGDIDDLDAGIGAQLGNGTVGPATKVGGKTSRGFGPRIAPATNSSDRRATSAASA